MMSLFFQVSPDANAMSPSFSRQEIIERDPGYWRVANQKCPLTNNTLLQNAYPLEPMKAISYSSDGKTVNSTIVLPQNLTPLSHTYLRSTRLNLTMVNLPSENFTLDQFTSRFVKDIHQNHTGYIQSRTILGGIPAYHVEYTFKNKSVEFNAMKQWTINGGRGYIISYAGNPSTYSYNLPIVKKMISSFMIGNRSNISPTYKQIDDFLKYENSDYKMIIQYPPDWQKQEFSKDSVHVVSFTFPFSEPFQHILQYSMAIHPAVIYDPRSNLTGGNHRVVINLEDNHTERWSKWTQEEFLDGYKRYLGKVDIPPLFGKQEIPLSLNLSYLNFPDRYLISFSQDDTFYVNNKPCIMVDDTDWYTIPQPQYVISASPSSVQLRPLEERDAELQIKTTNMVPSVANISIIPVRVDHDLNVPTTSLTGLTDKSKINVPLEGTATAILHIKAQKNSEEKLPRVYPLIITIKTNEQTPLPTFGRTAVATNSLTGNITQDYQNFTITLLKPFSIQEQFSNFWNVWGGFISFIGGGSAIGLSATIAGKLGNRGRRRAGVLLISILSVIAGISSCVSAIVFSPILEANIVLIVFIIGIPYLVMAYYLWNGNKLAWIITFIFSGIGVIGGGILIAIGNNNLLSLFQIILSVVLASTLLVKRGYYWKKNEDLGPIGKADYSSL